MRLLYHAQKRRWEAHVSPGELALPREAGFRRDLHQPLLWWTDSVRAAKVLEAHAAPDVRTLLEEVAPIPLATQLRYHIERERWECDGPRPLHYRPKEAGFHYDVKRDLWWTTNAEQARQLAGWADQPTQRRLEAAQEALAVIQAASRAKSADLAIPKPENDLDYLPFQRAGVEFALGVLQRGYRGVLICDEQGLGKSCQFLGLANCLLVSRVVAVVPANLKVNWAIEADRWLQPRLPIRILGTKKVRKSAWAWRVPGEVTPGPGLYIINYEILEQFFADLHRWPWDLIGCDEGHYLKERTSKRTQFTLGKRHKNGRGWAIPPLPAQHLAILTGTPIVNRPRELFPLLHACDPKTWSSYWGFAERYCSWHPGGDDRGSSNLPELQARLRSSIMLRRLKADVLPELPPKRRQVLEFAVGGASNLVDREAAAYEYQEHRLHTLRLAAERAKLHEDEGTFRKAVDELKKATAIAFHEIAAARREVAQAKIPLVIAHLKNVLESTPKVSVFAYHRESFAALEAAFPQSVSIHGGVEMGEVRQRMVDRFQQDPACPVFIGSILNAEGYTITASAHAVISELDYRPGKLLQTEDRQHRIGQAASVLIQYPVYEGSIDARIAKILVQKMRVIEAGLDTEDAEAPVFATGAVIPGFSRVGKEASRLEPELIATIHAALRETTPCSDTIEDQLLRELASYSSLTARQAVMGKSLLAPYRLLLPPDLAEHLWSTPCPQVK